MKCNEIIKYIEEWAPKQIAWERDNVGLQVGSTEREIENILLCLELTEPALDYAIKNHCNFIISHHPLLFNPIRKLNFDTDSNSILIEKLIKNEVTLYSAHTNLDFTKDGVSFELAKKLGLKKIDFLVNQKSNQSKVVIFVPEESVESVSSAIFNSGGGIIGEYSHCSFRSEGEGTFEGSENTNPAKGERGKYEKVKEIRLEALVDNWKLNRVLPAMLKAHPYEEPAYDVVPLDNFNVNYGAGAIGVLEEPLPVKDFLNYVSDKLKIKNFRYTRGKSRRINKVAVMGGSGTDFIKNASANNADAFITADVKYHTFHDAQNKILLIDAGHYETEIHSLSEIKRRLDKFFGKDNSFKVLKYKGSTNPIIFYNN